MEIIIIGENHVKTRQSNLGIIINFPLEKEHEEHEKRKLSLIWKNNKERSGAKEKSVVMKTTP